MKRIFRIIGLLTLALTLVSVGGVAAAHQTKTPTWVTTQGKTVNLIIIAAYNNAEGGFSFNGYNKGKMTITVPVGDKVNVTFSNQAPLAHNAQIVAYAKTPPATTVADAFKGANSPISGVMQGTTQKFSFVASKVGKYLLICSIPGHALAGMWDNFVVSKTAKVASMTVSK